MKKWLKLVLVTVVVVFSVLALAKNALIKFTAVSTLKKLTGLRMEIKNIGVGVFNSRLRIEGVKVFNPGEAAEGAMVDMPLLDVRYELFGFFKNRVHLYSLQLDLKQLNVDRTNDGKVNLSSLSALKPKNTGGRPPEISIDILDLKIGKVVYKDYSFQPPKTKEFDLNINEHIRNITDTRQLVNLILTRALMNTDLSPLIGILSDPEKAAKEQVEVLKQRAGEKLKEEIGKKAGSLFDKLTPKQ